MDPSSPTYELAVCRAASSLEVVTVTNFSLNRKIGRHNTQCERTSSIGVVAFYA